MLKKTLIFVCVLVVLVGMMVLPASAASGPFLIDYRDYVVSETTDGNYKVVTCHFDPSLLRVRIKDYSSTGSTWFSPSGNPTLTKELKAGVDYILYFQLAGDYLLWTQNLPLYCKTIVTPSIVMDEGDGYNTPSYYYHTEYFNEYGEYLYHEQTSHGKAPVDDPITVEGSVTSVDYACSLGAMFYAFNPLYDSTYTFRMTGLDVTFYIPIAFAADWENGETQTVLKTNEMLLRNQEILLNNLQEEQAITNDKLDELPGQVGDEMQGVIDSEKQEASDAGDSAAGELMDLIPNESQGFMDAVQSLVSSMSYSGTEAKLPVPAITIPAIPGVMDAIQLTDELYVDFGYWVQQLPSGVLKLVQILCTIALIVYCFKELYGMIAYAMTLKGGGSSE